MRLISRIWSLIRGSFSKKVRDLEWRSPETVLEEAANQKRHRASELLDALGRFRTALDRRNDRLKKMLNELQTVEDRLAIAQDLRDMQNGPELLRKQRILSEQIREERIELEADLRRREELEGTLKTIKEDIERFEVQRHRMTAEIRALQAQRQAQEIQQQFFTETNNSAVAAIQDRLQDERNRADLVTEMLGGSSRQMTNLDRRMDEQEFAAMCRQVDAVEPIRLEKPDFARLPSRLGSVTRASAS